MARDTYIDGLTDSLANGKPAGDAASLRHATIAGVAATPGGIAEKTPDLSGAIGPVETAHSLAGMGDHSRAAPGDVCFVCEAQLGRAERGTQYPIPAFADPALARFYRAGRFGGDRAVATSADHSTPVPL